MKCRTVKSVALQPTEQGFPGSPRAQRGGDDGSGFTPLDNTDREQSGRRSGWLARLLGEMTPPQPWEHRPASLAELWHYARHGAWTAEDLPPRHEGAPPRKPASRIAGVWWCRLVTIPASFLTHYTAWVIARPSRALTVAAVWAVLMHVPPIRTVAGWLLPFDPWPTWLP